MKKAHATERASPARPFSSSQSFRARRFFLLSWREYFGPGTRSSATTAMMTPGPTIETRPTVVMLMVSGKKGNEMLRSRRENGRLYGVMKFKPPPIAAIAL
jgi:hypothetical protein